MGTVVVLVLYNREHDNVGSRKKRMVKYLLVGSRLVGSSKDRDLKIKQKVLFIDKSKYQIYKWITVEHQRGFCWRGTFGGVGENGDLSH